MMIDYALSIKYSVTIVMVFAVTSTYSNYTDINLPSDHIKYYFNYFPTVAEECRNNTACPYKVIRGVLITRLCKDLSIKGEIRYIHFRSHFHFFFFFDFHCLHESVRIVVEASRILHT